jgi:hypothetical protein
MNHSTVLRLGGTEGARWKQLIVFSHLISYGQTLQIIGCTGV